MVGDQERKQQVLQRVCAHLASCSLRPWWVVSQASTPIQSLSQSQSHLATSPVTTWSSDWRHLCKLAAQCFTGRPRSRASILHWRSYAPAVGPAGVRRARCGQQRGAAHMASGPRKVSRCPAKPRATMRQPCTQSYAHSYMVVSAVWTSARVLRSVTELAG